MAQSQNKSQDHRQLRRRFLELLNYRLTLNEAKDEATVEGSGLTYDDYDMSGLPKPWKLLKLLQSVRFYAHHYPIDQDGNTFRDYAAVTDDRRTFIVSSELSINKDLYNRQIPKSPLLVKIQSGFIGTTSVNTKAVVVSPVGQKVLFTNTNQVVSIDTSSRKPVPWPDWWRNKYLEFGKGKVSLIIPKFSRPSDIQCYQLKVAWSDTDANNHSNWTSYLKYAFDAAHHVANDGALPTFMKNVEYGLKKIEMRFAGESHEGNILDVYVWENEKNTEELYVDIEKSDNSIFQAKIVFYEPDI